MIVLKVLAAPFVVALTLLVAIVSFLYCVASALCHIGCVVLTLLALVLFIVYLEYRPRLPLTHRIFRTLLGILVPAVLLVSSSC